MNLGKKIKQLRTYKGITQDTLAEYLNISFQAVSKWENGTAMPDISLLPKLSTYFGVTIDELFTLEQDAHLERIENMLENQRLLTDQEEDYAKRYLSDLMVQLSVENNHVLLGKAHGMLAGLYNHKARHAHDVANEHAKQAIALDPTVKDYHVNFVESARGVFSDWNYTNHHKLCAFYQDFTQANPDYYSGHLWLMDHLIADGRLDEARVALENLKAIRDNYLVPLYQSKIEMAAGNHQGASEFLETMVQREPENWLVWANRAEAFTMAGQYDKALLDFQKSMDIQAKPRYYDGFEAMAHIYEILGQKEQAIEKWQDIITLQKEEYNVRFGEMIDYPNREIARLEAK